MAISQEDIQQVLNAIKAESQGVDELETVSSLNGINSLPGVKDSKLVNVPMILLKKFAEEAAKGQMGDLADRLQYGGGLGMIGRFRGVKEEFTIPTPGSGGPTPFDILTPGRGTRIWFCAAVTYMTTDFPQRTRRRGTFVAEDQGHYYLNWTAKPLYGIMDSRGYNNGAAEASDEATMYDRISAENFAASAGPQPGGVFIDMLTGDFYLSDNTSSDGYMVIRAAGDSTLWHE